MRQKHARDVRVVGGFVSVTGNREAAFLQDAERGGIVLSRGGVERPGLFQAEEGRERFGRDAAAPEGAVESVAHFALSVRGPTVDVPGDLIPPRGIRRDSHHRHGHGIALVFEEEWQVARFHVA